MSKINIFVLIITTFFSNIKCEFYCRGIYVESQLQCPTEMSCPSEFIKINQFTCALNSVFKIESTCAINHECFDGQCFESLSDERTLISLCPSEITCPESHTKCHDNSCVNNINDCPEYFNCPSFIPIKCPNGDCRKNLNDCPSLLKCPNKFPMKCNDDSCHVLKSNCQSSSSLTKCNNDNESHNVRCSDGTCSNSKFLCPTPMTCPVGYIKCWNGLCVPKPNSPQTIDEVCDDPILGLSSTCGSDTKILCNFDHSCRPDMSQCPTGIICPVDRPVRCWDGSCKNTVESCPTYQKCPNGMKTCPDGSCSFSQCGTHITCTKDAPFRCYDNTCKASPSDCPAMPICPSDFPILCWDGRCLADRSECLSPSFCESSIPIKCPNNICAKSIESCKTIFECPSEFVKCPDGSCRKKTSHCNTHSCPLNFPFQCENGMCVSDLNHCEKKNGCPFNKPFKCEDGFCAESENQCEEHKVKDMCEKKGYMLCEDGSCIPVKNVCPLSNGCDSNTPIRCADGTCKKQSSSCAIPICPSELPIKCLDGTCVSTLSSCSKTIKMLEKSYKTGMVLCADGIEANNYEECKPLIPCNSNEKRCGDGTCRLNPDLCPLVKSTCPEEYNFRCEDGSCAKNEDNCLLRNGCPKIFPHKCEDTGLCVDDPNICERYPTQFDKANGCNQTFPLKCVKNGKCVKLLEECKDDNLCENKSHIMCPNGQCVKRLRECSSGSKCSQDYNRPVKCPGSKSSPCASSIEECLGNNNCPVSKPFRCANGECKRFPSKSNDSYNDDYCEISIVCPEYSPFLCADGSCVEKESFCSSSIDCNSNQTRCFDRTCVDDPDECKKEEHNKCPANNPIQCPNGNCVSNIFDCNDLSCPTWSKYKAIDGLCHDNPRDCTKIYSDAEHFYFGSICAENEFQCYDGTCRLNENDCPIFPGCSTLQLPFKCQNGGCAKDENSCEYDNIKDYFSCKPGEIIAEDGLCRKKDIKYQGCSLEKPLLCSTGKCVENLSECAGYSSCENVEQPFRCIDGSCARTISECQDILKEFGGTDIKLSVFPKSVLSVDIITGSKNLILGSIYMPSDTLVDTKEDPKSGLILVKSIPKSEIEDTFVYYDRSRKEDISLVFPYADLNNEFKLEYQYGILSSVVNISLVQTELHFKNKALLTLLYNFPFNHEGIRNLNNISNEEFKYNITTFMPLDYANDVCLGKLDEQSRIWNCVGFAGKVEFLDNIQYQGAIISSGIYAVILKPRENTVPIIIEDNFIIEHRKAILIVSLIVVIIIIAIVYVFIRVYRYKGKYGNQQKKFKDYKLEMNNLQEKSTEKIGQTFADTKEGVIFTDNPAFRIEKKSNKKNERILQLEKFYDFYNKKLKVLERNNEKLQSHYNNMKSEYEKLLEYKNQLKENDSEEKENLIKKKEDKK